MLSLTILVNLHSLNSVVTSQTCEILRKVELIAVKSHPVSSALVPIERKHATSY